MARAGARERIAVRIPDWEGNTVLEWRPRIITVILVIVLVALAAGLSSWDWDFFGPDNWEW